MKKILYTGAFVGIAICFVTCMNTGTPKASTKKFVVKTALEHPEWTESAVIYEVNIRQYTPEGTFNAFAEHLPRLEELGVDILWLMPVQPIGVLNRKGTLGSYYSISDYMSVNPAFGSFDDLRNLVDEAHRLGMYVILDWVANHTAWDNPLVTEHPEWYEKDSLGKLFSPYDWTDIVQLDFENPEMRKYMISAMKFWITETDMDGFRCDAAWSVPCDFWTEARTALDDIKPVFMLAEDEKNHCFVEKAFDMNYSWELHHLLNKIAKGTQPVDSLKVYCREQDSIYDPAIFRMNFITNHDENSWKGTEFSRLGDAVEVMAMLTFTMPGMPLIYSGQEIGMNKSLRFFEKDTIHWVESKWENIYKSFIELKTDQSVLSNGAAGGSFEILKIKKAPDVFAFMRENDNETMLVLANLSDKKAEFKLEEDIADRDYIDAFSQDEVVITKPIKLKGYEYMVLLEDF